MEFDGRPSTSDLIPSQPSRNRVWGLSLSLSMCIISGGTFDLINSFHFLSDPSPIIGNACHSLPNSLTNSLTPSCLENLIDVTLVCEDAYSKLVEVVTVADVDDEERVGNTLLQIWKLRFGHKG